MMKTIHIEDCDPSVQNFLRVLDTTDALMLCRNGKPRYILGEIDDFEKEVYSLARNQEFLNYLEYSRQRAKSEGTIPLADVRRQLLLQNENGGDELDTTELSEMDLEILEGDRIIAEESEAYRQMHPELLEKYPNQYVAIHQGKLIDRDTNRSVLDRRLDEKYADTTLLVRQVLPEVIPTAYVSSFRLE